MVGELQPDVLVIVLDCVRARDFVGGEDAVPGLRTAESLAREGRAFRRAIAPASWTFPSTASMFAGQYPWESGVYGLRKGKRFQPERTLADRLKARGFQTASFSANPIICPRTGLSRGFDGSWWGSFSDCFLRKLTPSISSPHFARSGVETGPLEGKVRESVQDAMMQTLRRYPLLPDVTTRVLSRLTGRGPHASAYVAPWIETAVERWLTGTRPEVPVFCFVNLLDAHDPYIGLPADLRNAPQWFDVLRVTQQTRQRNGQPARLDSDDAEAVRWLYRESIRVLDQRLAALTEIFRTTRNWDNTCVVVTSDHGQAFGEENRLFHTRGTPDAVHRIPLIVKPVHGVTLSETNGGWTSLARLPSIIGEAAFGGEGALGPSPGPAGDLFGGDPNSLALSLADIPDDGAVTTKNGTAGPDSEGPWVVGYWHDYKLTVDTRTLRARLFSVGPDGDSSGPSVDQSDARGSPLEAAVQEAARKFRENGKPVFPSDVSSRLRSWGY